MNKNDRIELEIAIEHLEKANEIIENIKDGEQDKFDNLSEGLQQTERGQKFHETVSSLEDAFYSIVSALHSVNEAIE